MEKRDDMATAEEVQQTCDAWDRLAAQRLGVPAAPPDPVALEAARRSVGQADLTDLWDWYTYHCYWSFVRFGRFDRVALEGREPELREAAARVAALVCAAGGAAGDRDSGE
jgi:hypothetical protein